MADKKEPTPEIEELHNAYHVAYEARFDVFRQIEQKYAEIAELNAQLPTHNQNVTDTLNAWRSANMIYQHDAPLPENFKVYTVSEITMDTLLSYRRMCSSKV